nr:helix-turn-helix domain-containing protein [Naumannella halotolerans]
MDELRTADEVAKNLRLSPRMVRKLAQRKTLACVRIGTRVLFRPSDIDEFIERHLRDAT